MRAFTLTAASALGIAFAMSGKIPFNTEPELTEAQKERIAVVQTCTRLATNAFQQGGMVTRAATQGCVEGYYVAKNILANVPR